MEVKRELNFDDLDDFFWSGARDRWNDATEEQKERVWDRLNEWFSDEIPSETEINDAVWFECDDIFNEKDDEKDESVQRRISKSRKLESDYDDEYNDEEFEVMSVDDIANWLSDLYETDVEANWDGDVLTLNVKTDNKKELSIEIFHDQSFSDMSIWYANYRTPKHEYSKELRLNDDDERAYAAELAMKFAKSKDWFNDDFKDDEEFESVRRRRNLRRVIESRRNIKEASLKDKVWVDFYVNGESDHGDEDVDDIESGIKLAKDWVSKKGKNNIYVARVLSGKYLRPEIHFVATNAKKGNIDIDNPIDFFAGTTDKTYGVLSGYSESRRTKRENLRRRITRK